MEPYASRIQFLTFFITPDKNVLMRASSSQVPVGAFYARLEINGFPLHARFFLGDDGTPLYSDCPFEEIVIFLNRKQVGIKGAPSTLQNDKDGDRIQGVILALVPAPKGGNQYVAIFIDQKSLKKGDVCYYSGTNGSIHTIYRSLVAAVGDADRTLLENFQGGNR